MLRCSGAAPLLIQRPWLGRLKTSAPIAVRCSLEIWETQRRLLGHLHLESGITLHDISFALSGLLAAHPRSLYASFPQWGSAAAAASAERRASELGRSVAALYALGGSLPGGAVLGDAEVWSG